MPRHDLSAGALASAVGLALALLAVALAGMALTRETGDIAVFWPVNGLLAGVLLRLPHARWPLALAAGGAAIAAANLLYRDPLWLAAGLAGCNLLEVLLAGHVARRLAGPAIRLTDLRQLFVLLAAGLAAPALSATVAAGLLGPALGLAPAALWRNWWTSNAVGMLLVLPLVASFDARPLQRLIAGPRDRQLLLGALELGAASTLLGVVLWLILEVDAYGSPALFTPILLWVALRFGAFGVAAAAAVFVVAAVTAGAYDAWPLPFTPGTTVASRVLPLQLFAVLVTLPPLIVAVLMRQRAQGLRRLDDALESMADAFALYDADGRLVICNRRYHEYLAPIADLLVPGVRFDDLVREGARRGIYALDDTADIEARIAQLVRAQNAGQVRELRFRDGRWLQVVPRTTAEGGTVLVCRDTTERKRLEQTLEHMAMHDPLTDLPNRKMYDLELRRARARAERDGDRLALMLLDLDRFKEVNDTYGHQVGDQLLVEVARRLVACVRAGDVVARVGGDEFAVIAAGSDGVEGFGALAERILGPAERAHPDRRDRARGSCQPRSHAVSRRSGRSRRVHRACRSGAVRRQAGRRPDLAAVQGRHGYRATAAAGGSPTTSARRSRAGELHLEYQPIVATGSGEVVGIEALVRWQHPRRGRLAASSFIATAERTPAILPLTRFVLRSALRQQRAWHAAGADLPVWVNLAPACLRWDGLLDAVTAALAEAGVAPSRLVLEVTENSFVDLERAASLVDQLRRLGVRVALDDLGASYSSLGRLRALPMDVVKIDRSFIGGLARDQRDRAVVQAMVTLGESLGLTPVAEGVETGEQLRVLRGFGCPWAQGHLFAPPLPPEQLAAWLAARHERHAASPRMPCPRPAAARKLPDPPPPLAPPVPATRPESTLVLTALAPTCSPPCRTRRRPPHLPPR